MSITFNAVPSLTQNLGRMCLPGAPEEINMANTNAYAVLALLGFSPQGDGVEVFGAVVYEDGAGECPAEDFLGRVLIAQAMLASATDDEHGQPGWADSRIIHFGRRAGYLAEKLGLLRCLAYQAYRRGWLITWS